ncbi:MAG: spondin domain-containing protein [Gammaproteobacteria bacterium]
MNLANGISRVGALFGLATLSVAAAAANVEVTFTNNAPSGGTWLTPLWVGFHDGGFDAFDAGAAASAGIEAIAEDGNAAPLGASFGGTGGIVGSGPLAPGASASAQFVIADDGSANFLSFAAMVLPSADFFIGNDDPHALALGGLVDGTLSRVSVDIVRVWDAGTEVNDFATSAANGLFGIPGGQGGPNEGADENGVVGIALGSDYLAFLNLGGADVAALDFSGYESIATVTVAQAQPVPLPASLPLALGACAALGGWRRRRTA